MSLYKEIESWYTQKGISLQQFRDGSTEQYLDEMTHDFMRRMLTVEADNKRLREEIEILKTTTVDSELYCNLENVLTTTQAALDEANTWQPQFYKKLREVNELKQKLDEAIKALEFYANILNWSPCSKLKGKDEDTSDEFICDSGPFKVAGKRARQALKSIRGEK